MAQLIQLRNRIKAVETIKKITHAMRLIAMSAHTRMRSKDDPFREYLHELRTLTQVVKQQVPDWHHPYLTPNSEEKSSLVILVGSQRGLCGNFNNVLFYFFEEEISPGNMIVVPIGKKAQAHLAHKNKYIYEPITLDFTLQNIPRISHQLVRYILTAPQPFTSISIISARLKTFFAQRPSLTQLIPSAPLDKKGMINAEEYMWEQAPADLLEYLLIQTLEAEIQYSLFQSLLAEQAARFISMDNATRNAQNILDTIKLSYNKLRQAKITKELSELSSTL